MPKLISGKVPPPQKVHRSTTSNVQGTKLETLSPALLELIKISNLAVSQLHMITPPAQCYAPCLGINPLIHLQTEGPNPHEKMPSVAQVIT